MELLGLTAVFDALNKAGAQYLVVGGLAVNAHGYLRMTMDVDLVIGLSPANILAGLGALSEVGFRPAVPITPEQFADVSNRERWRREKDMRVLKLWSDRYPLTPLDVFVYEPFDFAAEFAAATRVSLSPGVEVPVVRLPTLIAMKREAGRPQDLADLAALRDLEDAR